MNNSNNLFWICFVCWVLGIVTITLHEISLIAGIIAAVLFGIVFGKFTPNKKIVEDKE